MQLKYYSNLGAKHALLMFDNPPPNFNLLFDELYWKLRLQYTKYWVICSIILPSINCVWKFHMLIKKKNIQSTSYNIRLIKIFTKFSWVRYRVKNIGKMFFKPWFVSEIKHDLIDWKMINTIRSNQEFAEYTGEFSTKTMIGPFVFRFIHLSIVYNTPK